ncbi:TetR/AcrR family transcriptional regulator [Mycolicibacterium komossense]|uniref:TetR/AcrR family transcriptional regulator n=1 Tax=Mycolicibacterium komossense TaxID=1779 RepID=A0ABT3C525_9MYCO|nr:TetR/AcrR family transcriptional regulator [Mycolicibacterium komossense]MCV7224520.1 TetR/AcrR family transcriptional regulator [Mycolicibacterium komossense]
MAKPRAAPRQQRSRETYERVLDVAAEIFAECGYTGTTTNRVAEAAGISIGTLYHYIADKDALLYALAERHLASGTESIVSVFVGLRAEQPGLADSLRAVISVIVGMHVDEPHLHHLLYDSAPRSEELQKRLREADAAMADEVAWHLERLDVGGEHRRLVAALLVTGVEAQVHRATLDPIEPVSPEVLTDVLTNLWHRALTT